MDLITVQSRIENSIERLKTGREELKNRAKNKADTIAEYEKQLAIVILKLRNGVEMELGGEKVKDPPVTILEKIARGICWDERLKKEQAEAEYKNATVGMDALSAELNGWQSIFRHLD